MEMISILRLDKNEVEILTESPAGYAIFADLDGSLSGTTGGTPRAAKRQRRDLTCDVSVAGEKVQVRSSE